MADNKISQALNINSIQVKESSAPATPASGYGKVYAKTDGKLYWKDDAGTETDITGAGWTEGARAYNSANISCANGTTTLITLNSERYDTDGIHSTSSNTSRLTCNTAGKYLIHGQIRYAANGTGFRGARITINNTTQIGWTIVSASSASEVTVINVSTIYDLVATDYVELFAYQNSGGALNALASSNDAPEFMMHRIG